MKKKITVIIALFCIMSMLVALVACDGKGNTPDAGTPSGDAISGSPSGDLSSGEAGSGEQSENVIKVNEIQKFRSVLTAVLNEFSERLKVTFAAMTATSGDLGSGDDVGFEKSTAIKEIYDYMDAVEDKEVIEEKLMNEIAIRNFIAVRTYGELISEISNADKIYGVPLLMTGGENIVPSEACAFIVSKGTHIIVYRYGNDDRSGEIVYKWDIDYVSDKEFSAKMMAMSNGKPVYYFYGDTDGQSLLVINNGDDSGLIEYKTSEGDECYSCDNFEAVKQCLSKVEYEFDDVDTGFFSGLIEACEITATQQQYDKIANALCEEYGVA